MADTVLVEASQGIHAILARQPAWRRCALAFAAGALATVGLAPYHFIPAFVAGAVILIWLLDVASGKPRRLRAGFAAAWWFGFGYFLVGMRWLPAAFEVDAETFGLGLGIVGLFTLAGGLALFWGAAGAAAIALWREGPRRLAAFALTFWIAELARERLFGGLPWNQPGYIWPAGGAISQSASLFGIDGLTLFTLLGAAAPAVIADRGLNLPLRFAPIAFAALVFGLSWGAGRERLRAPSLPEIGETPIVRVADPGVSQRDKWAQARDQEWLMLDRYLAVSGGAEDSQAQVLIWPEGAIPTINFFVLENPYFLQELGAALDQRALVVGLTRRAVSDTGVTYFNSAAVIDGVAGQARVGQVYDKSRLVPFGEFIPLWTLFSDLNLAPLQRIGAGFTPGGPPTRIIIPDAPPAAVLICYEAIFPNFVPRGAERPGWIIALSNDAWFGGGVGPAQHDNQARYRTIEEGLPMARAASGGWSSIVDAYGRSVRRSPPSGGAAEALLPPALAETPFAKWGYFVLMALGGAVTALLLGPRISIKGRAGHE
ncbi:MAG: apolipoprotein N-acyltransferase [Alphaproteobacteria bacterium]|nr:apolipoprotein N-acyltransferase [Alphaproteobacteria bacterium]